MPTHKLRGLRSFFAIGTCVTPIVVGFFIPVTILSRLSFKYFNQSWTKDFQILAINSFLLAAIAAIICVVLAIFINYSRRLQPKTAFLTFMTRFASLGYAIPGAVLAIGILIPFATFDNYVDGLARKFLGVSTGLILSGTVGALLFAYVVRFLMIAIGQIGSSLEKVSLSIDMAARTLGSGARQTVMRYHVPLIKGSILSALTIVFVDCMKELPATLILRPFGFETLATHVYHYASDENLGEAALGSILIVATGLLPVIILCRVISKTRNRLEG